MDATFFESPSDFRQWLEENHATEKELWVGFYKVNSGKQSITWPESVDQALCFGWIDGIRKSIDSISYKIRFTPRKPRSIWSAVNIKRVGELTEMGLMQPPGIEAFRRRTEERSEVYSFEADNPQFDPAHEALFRADKTAWGFFQAQPPSYRKTATHWVISAKREETRVTRLNTLINDSKNGHRLRQFSR